MSAREHERAVVLGRVVAEGLRLRDAAVLMGVSYRQAKRLATRFRKGGRGALVHAGVGRRSNRSRSLAERTRVLELVREEFGGRRSRGAGQRFGPTLAAEHLEEEFGLVIPVRTLHGWMVKEGLWDRARKTQSRPGRRERRPHFGELVQLDGSFHDWYEGRGARAGAASCVMNMVDDATGEALLRFGEQETIWAAAHVLRHWIDQYGVPRALYTDWKNIYKRSPTTQERNLGVEAHTAFGLMCKKLGIRIIGAGSPQAKGRVERNNGVHQDRLIKKMRRLGIEDDAAANEYVTATYLPRHNARFAKPAADPVDYHLPLDPALNLDNVFCLEYRRVVGNDFVIQFEGQGLQLDRKARGRVPARSRVLVRQTQDGRIRVIHPRPDGQHHECTWTPAVPRTKTEPRTKTAPAAAKPAAPTSCPQPPKPAPDHPWRKAQQRDIKNALARRARRQLASSSDQPKQGTVLSA
jgi:transposase